jgi:hypothetical protein
MVAFVEVVGKNLPVVCTLHTILVIQSIILKVDILQSLLLINPIKVACPRLRVLRAIQVDPDKAICINLEMNLEQTVLALVESLQLVIVRRLGKIATQAIGPTVVLARKDRRVSLRSALNNGKCTVATHVVKGIEVALAVARHDKLIACDVELEPISCLGESVLVGDEKPLLGEDGALLELEHLG